jgi:spermidine dehydrogenase
MTFADFEAKFRDELDRMLGQGGFSSARGILAITVNRWSHGYGYVANSLFDGENYEETLSRARQTGGDAYAHCTAARF